MSHVPKVVEDLLVGIFFVSNLWCLLKTLGNDDMENGWVEDKEMRWGGWVEDKEMEWKEIK